MTVKVYFVLFAFLASAVFASVPITHYKCSMCLGVVDNFLETSNDLAVSMLNHCHVTFPHATPDICPALFAKADKLSITGKTSRKTCQSAGFCPVEQEPWQASVPKMKSSSSIGLDVRVSKALGSRGYNKIRLSVIANRTITSEHFSYGSPFKYRWTTNDVIGETFLNTGIVSVTPGQSNIFTIEGQNISVTIPKDGEGVRGVIIADPCFTSQYIVCAYQKQFNTFARTTELLNAILESEDTHYFQILGDNFYDQDGTPSATLFNALSSKTKSKIFASVPGNHEFWINASPALWVPKDQQGQGFMQFYGQDVIAAKASDVAMPYDLSVDPDGDSKGRNNLPPGSNFMFYNKVGNVAFIGFSGAHSFESQLGYFEEACSWASAESADAVLLLGHWDTDNNGCPSEMSTPALYSELLALPACASIAGKMKYFMGHKHCNMVTDPDVGFMVGAMGMADSSSCGGAFGLPVVDTTEGSFKVYYFPLARTDGFDNYDAVLNCVRTSGVSQCYHLATVWTSRPFMM